MSWLGDLERGDPAYPGSPGDPSTSAWSKAQGRELRKMLDEPRTPTAPLYVHSYDGYLWTCLGCGESHPDPCGCPCCAG